MEEVVSPPLPVCVHVCKCTGALCLMLCMFTYRKDPVFVLLVLVVVYIVLQVNGDPNLGKPWFHGSIDRQEAVDLLMGS